MDLPGPSGSLPRGAAAAGDVAPADGPAPTDGARPEPPPGPPPEVARFLVRGVLSGLPRRRRDRDVVLRWVASRALPLLDPMGERSLTERLAMITPDPVGLRRELVDAGLVTRTRDGAEYWRTRVTEYDPF